MKPTDVIKVAKAHCQALERFLTHAIQEHYETLFNDGTNEPILPRGKK